MFKLKKAAILEHEDGWKNILTNLGVENKDKRTGARVEHRILQQREVEAIYQVDDIAAKIVDRLPDEMLREGFRLESDADSDLTEKVMDYFSRHKIIEIINQSMKWARMYGGAGVIIGPKMQKDPEKPLVREMIGGIEFLRELDRHRLIPFSGEDNLDLNVASANFGKPVFYKIQNAKITNQNGAIKDQVKIHYTRIIRFEGVKLPYDLASQVDYWGDSVLSRLYNVIRNFQNAHDSAASIISDFTQMIVKLKNLADMIASGDDKLVHKRLQLMGATASIINAVVIEEGEEAERKTTNIAGLSDLLKSINDRLVAATDMPHTILLGESPSGLGASGQSEKMDWYDHVKSKQKQHLEPILRQFIDLSMAAKDGPTNGNVVDYEITFNPLWQPSEKEKVETRKMQAESDKIYIETGVLDPIEISQSRWGSGRYSIETQLDESVRNAMKEADNNRDPEDQEGDNVPEES